MVKGVLLVSLLMGQLPYSTLMVHAKHVPEDAKVTVQSWVWDSKEEPNLQTQCPYKRTLTPQQIRRMFATYHLLSEMEEHDSYLWYGCSASGTIETGGKLFHFVVRPVNLLRTDWPDGQWKPLGGKHSDNLSSK